MLYKPTNELYHHGVEGMKWGIRKSPKEVEETVRSKALIREEKEAEYNTQYNVDKRAHKETSRKIKEGRKFVTGLLLIGGLGALIMGKELTKMRKRRTSKKGAAFVVKALAK